jgi:hypothetical protein
MEHQMGNQQQMMPPGSQLPPNPSQQLPPMMQIPPIMSTTVAPSVGMMNHMHNPPSYQQSQAIPQNYQQPAPQQIQQQQPPPAQQQQQQIAQPPPAPAEPEKPKEVEVAELISFD